MCSHGRVSRVSPCVILNTEQNRQRTEPSPQDQGGSAPLSLQVSQGGSAPLSLQVPQGGAQEGSHPLTTLVQNLSEEQCTKLLKIAPHGLFSPAVNEQLPKYLSTLTPAQIDKRIDSLQGACGFKPMEDMVKGWLKQYHDQLMKETSEAEKKSAAERRKHQYDVGTTKTRLQNAEVADLPHELESAMKQLKELNMNGYINLGSELRAAIEGAQIRAVTDTKHRLETADVDDLPKVIKSATTQWIELKKCGPADLCTALEMAIKVAKARSMPFETKSMINEIRRGGFDWTGEGGKFHRFLDLLELRPALQRLNATDVIPKFIKVEKVFNLTETQYDHPDVVNCTMYASWVQCSVDTYDGTRSMWLRALHLFHLLDLTFGSKELASEKYKRIIQDAKDGKYRAEVGDRQPSDLKIQPPPPSNATPAQVRVDLTRSHHDCLLTLVCVCRIPRASMCFWARRV